MAKDFPNHEGFGKDWGHAELSCGSISGRRIYTLIIGLEASQPTARAAVHGTRPYPVKQTVGTKDLGEFTITFSDEDERAAFIQEAAALGRQARAAGFAEVEWDMTWILNSPDDSAAPVVHKYVGCTITDVPVSHSRSEEALGGDVTGTYKSHSINGNVAHAGMRAG